MLLYIRDLFHYSFLIYEYNHLKCSRPLSSPRRGFVFFINSCIIKEKRMGRFYLLKFILNILTLMMVVAFLIPSAVIKNENLKSRFSWKKINFVGFIVITFLYAPLIFTSDIFFIEIFMMIVYITISVYNIAIIIYTIYLMIKTRNKKIFRYLDLIIPILGIILLIIINKLSLDKGYDYSYQVLELTGNDSLIIKTLSILLILALIMISIWILFYSYAQIFTSKDKQTDKINELYSKYWVSVYALLFSLGVFIALLYFANYNIFETDDNGVYRFDESYRSRYYAIISFWHIITASIFIPAVIGLSKTNKSAVIKLGKMEKDERDLIDNIQNKFSKFKKKIK